MAENKFPSEVIDLPSEGKLYPEDSPLREGKLEIKYMTAKEEDILTSQNLIKKGLVIEKLLDSLILTKDVRSEDLVIGDKNAVMVAARILAYGPEYVCEVTNPNTGEQLTHTFNIADCPFVKLPKDVDGNNFDFELPVSEQKITFKLLTGKDERMINVELDRIRKLGTQVIPELTTRLRYLITSVDGETKQSVINSFVENMLSKDSLSLRQEITKVTPDIDLSQEIDIEGDTVKVDIPMTVNFFWPNTEA
jgi:hypothetical protein